MKYNNNITRLQPITSSDARAKPEQRAEREALGSTYESSSKKLSLTQNNAYFLQDNLRKLVHDKHEKGSSHRLCSCGVTPVDVFMREQGDSGLSISKPIELKRDKSGASISGLMTCKNGFYCPVCAPRVLIDKSNDLKSAIGNFLDEKPEQRTVIMVTQTLRHNKSHKLADLLTSLSKSNQRIKSGSLRTKLIDKFGFFSSVQSKECTWSSKNGWHPHLHELWFFDKCLTISDINELKSLLHSAQNRVLNRMGFDSSFDRGVDISFSLHHKESVHKYNTSNPSKFSHIPTDTKLSSSSIHSDYVTKFDKELTFEFTKIQKLDSLGFFGLLHMYSDTRSSLYADLVIEFIEVFHGKARIYIPKKIKEYIDIEHDIEDYESSRKPIFEFTLEQWKQVCFAKKRQEIYNIANNMSYSDSFIVKYINALLDTLHIKIPPAEYRFLMQTRQRDPTAWDWVLKTA